LITNSFFYLSRNQVISKLKKAQENRLNKAMRQDVSTDKMAIAKWHANSCYIDAIVEFLQRVVIPVDPCSNNQNQDDNEVTLLINKWKHILAVDGEVQATWHLRSHLWKYHQEMKYGEENDCVRVFEYLTATGPLSKLFSFDLEYDDANRSVFGRYKPAEFYCTIGTTTQLSKEFSRYYNCHAKSVPEFLTIRNCNDNLACQYDFAEIIEVGDFLVYHSYQICARVVKQTPIGQHFFSFIKLNGKVFRCDNMAFGKNQGPKLTEGNMTLSGKFDRQGVYTVYVFYQRMDTIPYLRNAISDLPFPPNPVVNQSSLSHSQIHAVVPSSRPASPVSPSASIFPSLYANHNNSSSPSYDADAPSVCYDPLLTPSTNDIGTSKRKFGIVKNRPSKRTKM
jgi:hypothetical protein